MHVPLAEGDAQLGQYASAALQPAAMALTAGLGRGCCSTGPDPGMGGMSPFINRNAMLICGDAKQVQPGVGQAAARKQESPVCLNQTAATRI